jgi:hypothetical protein
MLQEGSDEMVKHFSKIPDFDQDQAIFQKSRFFFIKLD